MPYQIDYDDDYDNDNDAPSAFEVDNHISSV